jgi:hypothetical protein
MLAADEAEGEAEEVYPFIFVTDGGLGGCDKI